MSVKNISTVAIVGGTHGNELSGIYLVNQWRQQPKKVERPSFNTELVLANQKAIENNRRYYDADLNRQFSAQSLADSTLANYEQSRAKVLNEQLGPKGNAKTDLIIDLHNTTSNMGPTLLIPQQGEFYSQLAAYVKTNMPEAVIFLDEADKSQDQHHLLCTMGNHGVIVEVGPVPQGVLKHQVYQQMETMTQLILDFVELRNNNQLPELPTQVEAFEYIESYTLPVDDNGNRIGMVHQHVEGQDFKALNPGEPLFQLFSGEVINYSGEETVYPTFINEAAYYDNNLAMSLCRKVMYP